MLDAHCSMVLMRWPPSSRSVGPCCHQTSSSSHAHGSRCNGYRGTGSHWVGVPASRYDSGMAGRRHGLCGVGCLDLRALCCSTGMMRCLLLDR